MPKPPAEKPSLRPAQLHRGKPVYYSAAVCPTRVMALVLPPVQGRIFDTRVAVFLIQTNVSPDPYQPMCTIDCGRALFYYEAATSLNQNPPGPSLGQGGGHACSARVMINATGCPAPVLDRNRMQTHKRLSQLIASAIDHVSAFYCLVTHFASSQRGEPCPEA